MSDSEKYWDLCETALKDYEKGKEAGQSIRALYNRLYYASFYAAKSALLSKEIEAKTHAGIADKIFTTFYKKENILDKKTAAVLSQIQTKRDISDYEILINEDMKDLRRMEEKVRNLIEELERIKN